jgi:predicted GH43/DUF377 family glycosyl hydrolase
MIYLNRLSINKEYLQSLLKKMFQIMFRKTRQMFLFPDKMFKFNHKSKTIQNKLLQTFQEVCHIKIKIKEPFHKTAEDMILLVIKFLN